MQELELAKRVIGRLPPGCRHVFLLSRSHGLSNLEIAARCGVSIKLVEKQISRALRELRAHARIWNGDRPCQELRRTIGRESCRERVCTYVVISVVAVCLKTIEQIKVKMKIE